MINMTKTFSDEHKRKLSLSHKGKKMTEETKHKISKSKTGVHYSEEAIRKSVESRIKSGNSRRTEETKKRISIANKKAYANPKLREILRLKALKQFKNGMPEETKIKLSKYKRNLGRKLSDETKAKIGKANKGRKMSLEFREQISKRQIGRIPWNKGKNHITNPELIKVGKESNNWKGGRTEIQKSIRKMLEYSNWRLEVYRRDNFTCQKCFQQNTYLHCHHIKSFAEILEENDIKTIEDAIKCDELWFISNGISLCVKCHYKLHKLNFTLRED